MSNKAISVYSKALLRQVEDKILPESRRENELLRDSSRNKLREKSRDKPRNMSRENPRNKPREKSRGKSRNIPRGKSRAFPNRDEIQEFSFHLRDESEVKVQAEIPYQWHTELEEITQHLNVKKIELYRFIYAEFLGKIRRKKPKEI